MSGFMHSFQLLEYRKTKYYFSMLAQGGLTESGHWNGRKGKGRKIEEAGRELGTYHYLTISITDYGI